MQRSGDISMASQASKVNPLNIRYIKLVNHTGSKRSEWSYPSDFEIDHEFRLHWALNESKKSKLTEAEIAKALERKRKDANKPKQGNQIILFQNHVKYGHRFTHVVEVISSEAELKDEDYWTRKVKVVWASSGSGNWDKDLPPETKKIVGSLFKFNSGYLVQIEAPTINFNLENLTQITSGSYGVDY
jgi:hypothetical protein